MNDRVRQLEAWCAEQIGTLVAFEPLAQEASTREFYRATTPDGSRIAMDAPPETENNAQFRALSELFRVNGVPVPKVVAFDPRGFLLVSDFGDRRFDHAYAEGREEECLDLALDALLRIQSVASDIISRYEVSRFRDELGIFTEWLVGRFLGLDAPAFIDDNWEVLIAATQAQPMATVHRDYHSRNLLLRDDGSLGIVDFQDALFGPVTYDLVSLLRDCYHVFPEDAVEKWLGRYRVRSGCGLDSRDLRRAFDLTGVQRHLKAAGIFARLKLRDGRDSHLRDIVPTLERVVDVTGGYRELADLNSWVGNVVVPAARRRVEGP